MRFLCPTEVDLLSDSITKATGPATQGACMAAPSVGESGRDSRPGSFATHDLRHTAVALWIAAGASPLEVSRRAGHTGHRIHQLVTQDVLSRASGYRE
jgi:hypothetical protein